MGVKNIRYKFAAALVLSVLLASCQNDTSQNTQDLQDKIAFGWIDGTCLTVKNLKGLDPQNLFIITDTKAINLTPLDINDEAAISACPSLRRMRFHGLIDADEPLDVTGRYTLSSPYDGTAVIVPIMSDKAPIDNKALSAYLETLEVKYCTTNETVVYNLMQKSDKTLVWQDREPLGYGVEATCPEDLQYLD